MQEFHYDEKYMRRALQLAANGRGFTRSNPMVGAVIVAPDGRVIGEGWHRKYGEGHAEVNAVASVKEADRPLMKESTIYVTLEPCSHYGKTPPCAKLLIDCGFPKVVVGAGDPNPKVNGRGIAMLRQAGAKVITGVLEEESIALNKVFFTSQTLHRPYIFLKWAQSADGFMDIKREHAQPAFTFSTPLSRLATMKLRSECQAIMTTAATFIADRPRLTLRSWAGEQPLRFILDRSNRLPTLPSPPSSSSPQFSSRPCQPSSSSSQLSARPCQPSSSSSQLSSSFSQLSARPCQPAASSSSLNREAVDGRALPDGFTHLSPSSLRSSLNREAVDGRALPEGFTHLSPSSLRSSLNREAVDGRALPEGFTHLSPSAFPSLTDGDLLAPFTILYNDFGITSVLVEAGPRYLSSLLDACLWDELRVEISSVQLGAEGAHHAPSLPGFPPVETDGPFLYFRNKPRR